MIGTSPRHVPAHIFMSLMNKYPCILVPYFAQNFRRSEAYWWNTGTGNRTKGCLCFPSAGSWTRRSGHWCTIARTTRAGTTRLWTSRVSMQPRRPKKTGRKSPRVPVYRSGLPLQPLAVLGDNLYRWTIIGCVQDKRVLFLVNVWMCDIKYLSSL